MGAIVPILTSTLISQGVGLAAQQISGRASRQQALNQLQQRQNLQAAQAAQDAALSREQIALNASLDNEERKKALKRAVARQRANFGAQGVGAGAGSSQAVLLGLFEESEDDKRSRDALDNMRLKAIDQDLSQSNAINVLQRTQLEEKGRLSAASSLGQGALSSLF